MSIPNISSISWLFQHFADKTSLNKSQIDTAKKPLIGRNKIELNMRTGVFRWNFAGSQRKNGGRRRMCFRKFLAKYLHLIYIFKPRRTTIIIACCKGKSKISIACKKWILWGSLAEKSRTNCQRDKTEGDATERSLTNEIQCFKSLEVFLISWKCSD